MTLGGFAVAIGVVVDDAIIVVENILRRLRENAALAVPRPLSRVVLDASIEVRGAVVYATLIVCVVFLPVLTMSGLQGRFFAPLGVAFILSTLASLAVALTVTPALCLMLLGGAKVHAEPAWVRWMKVLHRDWCLFRAPAARAPGRSPPARSRWRAALAAAAARVHEGTSPRLRCGPVLPWRRRCASAKASRTNARSTASRPSNSRSGVPRWARIRGGRTKVNSTSS
jgi:multidrug efflux pump subunit AcrB